MFAHNSAMSVDMWVMLRGAVDLRWSDCSGHTSYRCHQNDGQLLSQLDRWMCGCRPQTGSLEVRRALHSSSVADNTSVRRAAWWGRCGSRGLDFQGKDRAGCWQDSRDRDGWYLDRRFGFDKMAGLDCLFLFGNQVGRKSLPDAWLRLEHSRSGLGSART